MKLNVFYDRLVDVFKDLRDLLPVVFLYILVLSFVPVGFFWIYFIFGLAFVFLLSRDERVSGLRCCRTYTNLRKIEIDAKISWVGELSELFAFLLLWLLFQTIFYIISPSQAYLSMCFGLFVGVLANIIFRDGVSF